MNRLALGLVVLALATPALAASGEMSGVGRSTDRLGACEEARKDARSKAQIEAMGNGGLGPVRILGSDRCDCVQEDVPLYGSQPTRMWKCLIRIQYTTD